LRDCLWTSFKNAITRRFRLVRDAAADTIAPNDPRVLYFNPHKDARTVGVSVGDRPRGVGDRPRDLYDCVAGRFMARGVKGEATVAIAGDSAVVLVVTPAGGKVTREGRKMLVDGVVVDYRAE